MIQNNIQDQDFSSFDQLHFDAYIYERLLNEGYHATTLVKVLLGKLARKLFGPQNLVKPVVFYNGLVVFDRLDLHGGGLSLAQDYCRVLLELGLKRCERIYEFCSGPGYIGYSLLANGFCERLTLADVNPIAVEVTKYTAKFNNIEHLVNIYLSDILDQMPKEEKWDLVVGNPPNALPGYEQATKIRPYDAGWKERNDLRSYDPDWSLHKRFYAAVKQFMKPGGYVVMAEIRDGSTVETFEPMIQAGGGKMVATKLGVDIRGKSNNMYYIMSEW